MTTAFVPHPATERSAVATSASPGGRSAETLTGPARAAESHPAGCPFRCQTAASRAIAGAMRAQHRRAGRHRDGGDQQRQRAGRVPAVHTK